MKIAGFENFFGASMDISSTPIELIQELKSEINKMLNCNCAYVDSIVVHEICQEKIAWEGVVEVFKLFKHDGPEWVYAWKSRKSGKARTHLVLGDPPVNSAVAAVRAWLLNHSEL